MAERRATAPSAEPGASLPPAAGGKPRLALAPSPAGAPTLSSSLFAAR